MENGKHNMTGPIEPANRTIFVLLFVIAAVATVFYGATDTWALIILAPLIALLSGVWVVRSIRKRAFEIDLDAIQLPVLALLLLGVFQLLPLGGNEVSPDALGVPASAAITLDPFTTRIFLIRLVGYIIFFAAALTFINTRERLRKTFTVLIVFGGILAFAGIIQKLASPDAIYGVRKAAQAVPFGPYVNQHHFASLMVLLSGVALAHLFGNAVSRQTKILIGIGTLIMVIAVPLTGSRGGMISFAAMLGVAGTAFFYDAASDRKRTLIPAFVGLATVAVIAFGTVVFLGGADTLLRGVGFQNTSDDISSGRIHFWSVAWQIFASNPIFGAGLDAFGFAFTRFDTRGGMYRVEQAHNEYLQMLADGGVLGFACVAAFIAIFYRKMIRGITHAGDAFARVTAIGALAGCTGIFVHSFFDFPLRTAGNAFWFLLVAALGLAAVGMRERED